MDLANIRGIIFDLDGTLYEDTEHFRYYAERLAKRLPSKRRKEYWLDVQAIWDGQHVLRLGRVFDRMRDLVLETTPDGKVLKAWTWQGEPYDEKLYSQPVSFDMTKMISIGDGWWIPSAAAYHHGLKETYNAYLETKDYLSSPGASLTPIPGLASWLAKLQEQVKMVVVTNSDLADTKRILKNVGLDHILTSIYPDANKPKRTREVLTQVAQELALPNEQILSVGDNYLNDIFPAQQLGMKTCLIDPHGIYAPDTADIVIRSLRELYQA